MERPPSSLQPISQKAQSFLQTASQLHWRDGDCRRVDYEGMGPLLNRTGSRADESVVLTCQNCHRPVTFARDGWSHLDRATECPVLVIAWPPPGTVDGEEDAA